MIQNSENHGKMKKLIVFDLEESLIEDSSLHEYLIEIDKSCNFSLSSNEISDLNMETLLNNFALTKDLDFNRLKSLSNILKIKKGTHKLIKILKSMGFKIAIISSGFNAFIKNLNENIEIDYAFSNTVIIDENEKLTGELEEPIITDKTKSVILNMIMKIEHLQPENIIAIGNGSKKSSFIYDVGLSIACKPSHLLDTNGLFISDSIIHLLYSLGVPKTEIDVYLKD